MNTKISAFLILGLILLFSISRVEGTVTNEDLCGIYDGQAENAFWQWESIEENREHLRFATIESLSESIGVLKVLECEPLDIVFWQYVRSYVETDDFAFLELAISE